GTWMAGAGQTLGSWASGFESVLYNHDYTYLVAVLPPGGFFVLALLIALKNAHAIHQRNRRENRFRIKSSRD
ncbi:MAG: electron transport complex subunit RsxE, partial [Succinatimonas hippei]|nr:electron transport complex subunit RsxE [Succinatimonas hippei]